MPVVDEKGFIETKATFPGSWSESFFKLTMVYLVGHYDEELNISLLNNGFLAFQGSLIKPTEGSDASGSGCVSQPRLSWRMWNLPVLALQRRSL